MARFREPGKRREPRTPSGGEHPAKPRKAAFDVSYGALQRAHVQRLQQRMPSVDLFSMKHDTHPPGVRPTRRSDGELAMDDGSVVNVSTLTASSAAWANFAVSSFAEGQVFPGYPFLSELSIRAEYRNMVETIATECTRRWINLKASGDKDKTDRIKELTDYMNALNVRGAFGRSIEIDGNFGRSHIYLDTGATDDRAELVKPIGNGWDNLSKAKVTQKKGKLGRLQPVEPVWCYPTDYNSNDPLKADWYKPTQWYALGKPIHCTRLLTFIGREVPDLYKPAYSFGGLSMIQMAKPYVDNWLQTRQAVADLIKSFSVFVLGTNMGASLAADGDQLFRRLDLWGLLRDNRGVFVRDKDTEEMDNISAPLGTLDALQAQTQEHMAAVSKIPLVKLLGIQPAGLNASSEGEIRTFYDTIHAYQDKFISPNLRTVIGFCMLSLWGEVDEDITHEFVPLWSLDEKGEAEVRKLNAETGQIHIDSGVVWQEEERKRVALDPSTPYHGLDIEDVPELEQEIEGGLVPKGAGGGVAAVLEDDDGGDDKGEAAEDGVIPFDHAADDGTFHEQDHPRRDDGKFGTGGGGAATEAESGSETSTGEQPEFKTKKDHAAHLLTKGATAKELMNALGWPSISVPATAKSLGMNLEKVKEGKTTRYIGTPMTAEERKKANLMPEGVRRSGGPAARDPDTWSLLEFIVSQGGIDPKDALIGDVRSMLGTKNKFVPGFGSLIRPGGKRLDRMRESAVEAGYIFDPSRAGGGMSDITVRTLIDTMDTEARGQRVYKQGHEPEAKGGSEARSEENREENRRHHEGELDAAMQQAEIDPATFSEKQRDRILEIMDREGITDPLEAIERESMEWVTDAAETGRAERILDDIPGWDVPDDPGPAPRASAAAAPF